MSLQLNHVQFAGNVTRDPQVRFLAGDRTVASFGLALNRSWTDAEGERMQETTFLEVEAWGRAADFVGRYLLKGTPVYVAGRLKIDQWQDREGVRRSRPVVVASTVQFVESRRDQGTQAGTPAAAAGASAAPGAAAAAAGASAAPGAAAAAAAAGAVRTASGELVNPATGEVLPPPAPEEAQPTTVARAAPSSTPTGADDEPPF